MISFQTPSEPFMATAFLTDATFWITICAARLHEIGAHADFADAEVTAADLFEDEAYRALGPSTAAEVFRGRHVEAKAA
jgi:hypothetical protein